MYFLCYHMTCDPPPPPNQQTHGGGTDCVVDMSYNLLNGFVFVCALNLLHLQHLIFAMKVKTVVIKNK